MPTGLTQRQRRDWRDSFADYRAFMANRAGETPKGINFPRKGKHRKSGVQPAQIERQEKIQKIIPNSSTIRPRRIHSSFS